MLAHIEGSRWQRIARRVGEDKLLEAIRSNKEAWPTILDPITG